MPIDPLPSHFTPQKTHPPTCRRRFVHFSVPTPSLPVFSHTSFPHPKNRPPPHLARSVSGSQRQWLPLPPVLVAAPLCPAAAHRRRQSWVSAPVADLPGLRAPEGEVGKEEQCSTLFFGLMIYRARTLQTDLKNIN